jgi:carboxypeptidase C (cathepsin A)
VSNKHLAVLFVLLLTSTVCAAGQDPPAKPTKPEHKPEPPKETIVETEHALALGQDKLTYKATTGTLLLKEEDGKATASVFFIAYTKSGVEDLSKRPVMFAFNGGPGSSSVWLHLGAFGPRRVLMKDDGEPVPPPPKLVDNEATLLDVTDLVFIDPVTTGYSRPAPGQDPKQFHGVQQDLQSVGEFIRLYTTRYRRWASPKFIAGESYGTTRAAGLAAHLQERHGLSVNGIILVSAVLNFQTIRFDEGNDLPYILFLPAYTATAWYHKKLAPDLQSDLKKALAEAERFAIGDYTLALMKGSKLSAGERLQIARQVARLTGLSEEFVQQANLRINMMRFGKELLRDERRTVGRYDSRLVGHDVDAAGEVHEYDPSYAAVLGSYTAALNHYLRTELRFESDLPYEILTGRVQPWDYGDARNRYLNVSRNLRQVMTQNRTLRVFVASGYYDLATPYFATDYTVDHLGLDGSLADRVTTAYYEAGHMMYIHKPSLVKLKRDVAAFISGVRSQESGVRNQESGVRNQERAARQKQP